MNTPSFPGLNDLITAVKQLNIGINTINQTIAKVFPQGETITTSAGSSSGKYITITGTDGNTYKIALFNPV